MANDHACAIIVPDGYLTDARKLWCAMGHDTMPGATFASRLSATGLEPATHHGAGSPEPAEIAAMWQALPLDGGTLPTTDKDGNPINWADFDLTEETAKAAAASLHVSVSTGGTTSGNYAAVLLERGLTRVEHVDDF